jgi:hypothetical protein
MAARASLFSHLTYVSGTANAPTSDAYTIDLTLDNVASVNNHKLQEVRITFPSSIDLNANTPTIVSAPSGTGNWRINTNSAYAALGGANVIELTCAEATIDGCGISVGSSGTFELKFPIFQSTFTEQATPMLANYNGAGCTHCGSGNSYQIGATQTLVNGIAGQTGTSSMMLGNFSLNPTLMSLAFIPSTVGTNLPVDAALKFTNTSTSQDANPDWVDQVDLVIPGAMTDPNSITVPSGWVATETSSKHWTIAACSSPANATPCTNPETSFAIAPGGTLGMTLNYTSTAPATGTFAVTWYATGANGGEDTHVSTTAAAITFSATAATVAIASVGGVAVPSGMEPQVGTDTSASGNSYTYVVTNTGSTAITSVNVTVPYTTRAITAGDDASGLYYTLTSAPIVTLSSGSSGTPGTCSGTLSSAQYASAASSGNGKIDLSGCSILPGGTATITFTAKAPYLIASEFVFGATINGTSINATSSYTASNVVLVVINGTLTILTPGSGYTAPTSSGNVLTAAAGSGASPATSCVFCAVVIGSPSFVVFGAFSGTFVATDIVDASVWSDANSPNSWVLYASTSVNPSNMLSGDVDSTGSHSSSASGFTIDTSTMTLLPTSSPGLQLSTYGGTPRHNPLDSVMNFQVATGGITTPEQVTLTYTLVFN